MKHASRSLLTSLSLLLLLLGASAQAQQKLPPPPFIVADNNPVVIPAGRSSGTVTLEWDGGKDHPYAEVWVRVDENDETFIVEQGRGIRNVKVEFGKSYEFKLSDSNVLLASVRVTVRHKAPAGAATSQSGVTPSSVPAVAPSDFAGCVERYRFMLDFLKRRVALMASLERLQPNQPRDRVGVFVEVADLHALVKLSSQTIKSFVSVFFRERSSSPFKGPD